MRERTGRFLERIGILTADEVSEILHVSRQQNMTFGEAAVRLGRLKSQSPLKVRHQSLAADFFHLDPKFFPQATKNLISVPEILKYGVLPLGTKKVSVLFREKRILNVGYIDPTQSTSIQEFESQLRTKVSEPPLSGVHRYLVLMEEFLNVLESHYGISEESLQDEDPTLLEPSLSLFLKEPTVILDKNRL